MSSAVTIAIASLTLAAGSVAAQTPAAPAAPANFTLPRAYAGYSQPEITQCATSGASRRSCVTPAMTAGRYVILARASATATGANATQTLSIELNGEACAGLKSDSFTGTKAVPPIFCQVTLLTDAPLTISADYRVENATADPAGPRLVVRRLPWTGVLETSGGQLPVRPAPVAPAKK